MEENVEDKSYLILEKKREKMTHAAAFEVSSFIFQFFLFFQLNANVGTIQFRFLSVLFYLFI